MYTKIFRRVTLTPDRETFGKHRDTDPISIAILLQKHAVLLLGDGVYTPTCMAYTRGSTSIACLQSSSIDFLKLRCFLCNSSQIPSFLRIVGFEIPFRITQNDSQGITFVIICCRGVRHLFVSRCLSRNIGVRVRRYTPKVFFGPLKAISPMKLARMSEQSKIQRPDKGSLGCTPRGSCKNTLLRRVVQSASVEAY